jgi:hypothetical protein
VIDKDYFKRKAQELGLDRADDLARVQALLDEWYPGLARARRLHRGVLWVITPSSGVASELRMRQLEVMEAVSDPEARIRITITSLD